jgi:hypothetical protein
MSVKLTVNLPDDAVAAVKQIADDNQISMTEALRQLIANERYLHNDVKKGSKVLVEKPDGTLRELILSTSRGLKTTERA